MFPLSASIVFLSLVTMTLIRDYFRHLRERGGQDVDREGAIRNIDGQGVQQILPFQGFVAGIAMKACHVMHFFLRLSFLLLFWLLISPFGFWTWQMFPRSASIVFLFLGPIPLSASIVFLFLGENSLRHYFKYLEQLGEQDVDTEDGATRQLADQANTNNIVGDDAANAQGGIQQNRMSSYGKERSQLGLNTLYIKNLHDSVDDHKLKELFSPFGTIISCKVNRDEKGISKGSGFVAFSTSDEASKAISVMKQKMVCGKLIYVAIAEKEEARTARLQAGFSQLELESTTPTVCWIKPKQGWIKLNTDGCLKRNGEAAGGGVLRDSNGDFILAFCEFYDSSITILEAEIKAMATGLRLCLGKGYDKVWLECDSQIAVRTCLEKETNTSNFQYDVVDIRRYMEKMEVKLTHIWREANSVADHFADMGILHRQFNLFYTVADLPEVKSLLHFDKISYPYTRQKKN